MLSLNREDKTERMRGRFKRGIYPISESPGGSCCQSPGLKRRVTAAKTKGCWILADIYAIEGKGFLEINHYLCKRLLDLRNW
jgi:hypothetical protein